MPVLSLLLSGLQKTRNIFAHTFVFTIVILYRIFKIKYYTNVYTNVTRGASPA